MNETNSSDKNDLDYMAEALKEAQAAELDGEVPVGAVLVCQGQIIARGRNCKEASCCSIRHAEIEALEAGSKALGRWRLHDCSLYVTLEPCVMCAGAISAARVGRLVFGAQDPKGGGVKSLYQILDDKRLNHQTLVKGGIFSQECGLILTMFFQKRRKK